MVHVPFVDLRSFHSDEHKYRLARPVWPTPDVGQDFVRKFGVVRPTPGGGLLPWTGEEYFCDASRTLKYIKPLRTTIPEYKLTQRWRRLFTNGIVGRVEVALHASNVNELEALALSIGSMPVRIGKREPRRIVDVGSYLSKEYAEATVPVATRSLRDPAMSRLVKPGTPLLLLEKRVKSTNALSDRTSGAASAVTMEHTWLKFGSQPVALWTIVHSRKPNDDEVRRSRKHAIRLHCEMESFASVLRGCRTGLIDLKQSDALDDYLKEASVRLLKRRYCGFDQVATLKAIAEKRERAREGELNSLNQTFRDVNRSFQRLVEDAWSVVEPRAPYGDSRIYNLKTVLVDRILVDNSINLGSNNEVSGIVGSGNEVIGNSNFSGTQQNELSVRIQELESQLRQLSDRLEGNEVDFAQVISMQVKQGSVDVPRTRGLLDLITDGVKKVGEAGVPVLQTIAKLQELLP